jgi:hypothetical protein
LVLEFEGFLWVQAEKVPGDQSERFPWYQAERVLWDHSEEGLAVEGLSRKTALRLWFLGF